MSIRVRNLTFRYGNFELRVPELDFESAKLTAIVGPNGAGKTTFLKCLSGILPAPRGALSLDGLALAGLPESERARRLAFVPQEHSSVFNYTILDFVLMGRAAYVPLFSTPSESDVAAARGALDYVGLSRATSRPYVQLSSGERRLVLIARALAQSTDILVLDEPTTFLDPKHETELMDLIGKLARDRNKTVLVTLHNLDLAVRYADVMVFMKNGAIVASGPPGSLLSEDLLERIYEIKMTIIEHGGRTFIVK